MLYLNNVLFETTGRSVPCPFPLPPRLEPWRVPHLGGPSCALTLAPPGSAQTAFCLQQCNFILVGLQNNKNDKHVLAQTAFCLQQCNFILVGLQNNKNDKHVLAQIAFCLWQGKSTLVGHHNPQSSGSGTGTDGFLPGTQRIHFLSASKTQKLAKLGIGTGSFLPEQCKQCFGQPPLPTRLKVKS